ncbi:MAG: S4 domain-containing protein [Eubacteriales bacterium]
MVELLVKTNLAASKSDARRLIQGGGIKLDGTVVNDMMMKVTAGEHVFSRGKNKYAKVKIG